VLAEMIPLKTDNLIYITYSSESAVFLRVIFDQNLWEMILSHAKSLYDITAERQTKTNPQTKVIKNEIRKFVQNNVTYMCEV
jgi:hypothetical protein